MTDRQLYTWAVLAIIAFVSFIFGGGAVWAFVSRGRSLMIDRQIENRFPTRVEFDAYCKFQDARFDRLMQDFIHPIQQQTAAITELSRSISTMTVEMRHFEIGHNELKTELKALTAEVHARRSIPRITDGTNG